MISVVIPAYNEEKTIGFVLDGVKKQINKAELIVLDDNSKDKTRDIAIEKGAIVVSNNYNIGVDASLEKGLKMCSGDIIVTLDSDGEHIPEDIKLFLDELSNGYDFVKGYREELPRISEKHLEKYSNKKIKLKDPLCSFRVFKREVYDKIGYYDKLKSYGAEFLFNAVKNGFKVNEIKIKSIRREGVSRIGNKLGANLKLYKAFFKLVGRFGI
ncbi:MAG: glycosyltransferase family 2 protein [Candidatus Nanoarchaeia archaeon]|nr:glycosyltransferase family 2 protein [Candidatus Nanoarchaeia archaeon]